MNEYIPSKQQIKDELDAIRSLSSRTWPEVGKLLLSIEFHGYWRVSSSSFSEWIRDFARVYGKSESTYWRILSSSRYYLELRKYLMSYGIEAPLLENLSPSVSPENLELLMKIERVLPSEQRLALAQKVISSCATRAELRDYWFYYKPILNGRNARSKNLISYEHDNPEHQQSLVLANILKTLSDSNGEWLTPNPKSNITLVDITLPAKNLIDKTPRELTVNLITVTNDSISEELILHGFELLGIRNEKKEKIINYKRSYFNYFWLAIHNDFVGDIANESSEVGVVTVSKGNEIKIIKPAIKKQINKDDQIDILEIIIKKIAR